MNIKQNILILSLAALLSGCGEDSSNTTDFNTMVGKAIQKGQIKDNRTGEALSDVTVSIGKHSTTTNDEGYYTLTNLTRTEEATINFEKEGYFLGSKQIEIKIFDDKKGTSTNYVEFGMFAYSEVWENGREWTYQTQNGASGGAVIIPEDVIYTDINDKVYKGTIYARWVFKDTMTEEGKDTFPGSFKGLNTNGVLVPFVSYGLTSLELRDNNGSKLKISGSITLVLPTLSGTVDNILPLWYYDYNQGVWIAEGYAQRDSDGSYKAEISHAGTWSLNIALEEDPGIYRGRIVDENDEPIGDVRVYATGKNWVSSDLTTDENGVFELDVIPSESFRLFAYNYKDEFGAKYDAIISPITSGTIVEENN